EEDARHPGCQTRPRRLPAAAPQRSLRSAAVPRTVTAPRTGSFYEAACVKSQSSFFLFLPSGAHLPRLPLGASSFSLPWFLPFLCLVTSLGGSVFRRVANWRLRLWDAGSPWRSPATTFYPCRPTGRST